MEPYHILLVKPVLRVFFWVNLGTIVMTEPTRVICRLMWADYEKMGKTLQVRMLPNGMSGNSGIS